MQPPHRHHLRDPCTRLLWDLRRIPRTQNILHDINTPPLGTLDLLSSSFLGPQSWMDLSRDLRPMVLPGLLFQRHAYRIWTN